VFQDGSDGPFIITPLTGDSQKFKEHYTNREVGTEADNSAN